MPQARRSPGLCETRTVAAQPRPHCLLNNEATYSLWVQAARRQDSYSQRPLGGDTLRRYRATTLFLLNATQIVDYGLYSPANDRLRIAREVENGCGTIPKPLLFLLLAQAFLLVAASAFASRFLRNAGRWGMPAAPDRHFRKSVRLRSLPAVDGVIDSALRKHALVPLSERRQIRRPDLQLGTERTVTLAIGAVACGAFR